MSLYNLTNFTTSRDPAIWAKTANTFSDGALGIGIPILLWFIVFVGLASRGLTKYAFAAASFTSATSCLPLVLIGLTSWPVFFVFVVFTGISGAMLVYDRGF